MKNWVYKFLILISCATPAFAAEFDHQANWEKISDDQQISTFRKEIPGSSIVAFKGEAIIDAPISKVSTIVLDTTRAKEWVDSLEESKVVRFINPLEFIEYDHIGTPIVMKDREFVSHILIHIDAPKQTIVIHYAKTGEGEFPPTDYVRGELDQSEYRMTSIENGKKTQLAGEIFCDPRGSVPKWIVNLFQKSWPRNTIEAIRKQAAKSDIKEPQEFAEFFKQLHAVF